VTSTRSTCRGGATARGLRRTRGLAVTEEVGEKVVEETAAATEAARHLFLGEIDLTEVFDFLRAVGTQPNSRCDGGSSVTLANRLIDGHLGTSCSVLTLF
jgi:hypothetical protein